MVHVSRVAAVALVAAFVFAGCATTPENGQRALGGAQAPAWSLYARQDEMVVAVSPAGKALRVFGSAGLVVGTAVDAGVNAKYARIVEEKLAGYDTAAVLDEALSTALAGAVGPELERVTPMSGTAGYSSRREAEQAYYRGLGRQGLDTLLELKVAYGLYGPEGTMAARVQADLVELPGGRTLWDDKFIVWSGPVLADTRLVDPTNRLAPDLKGGLTVDDEAIAVWADGDGGILRERYEEVVHGVVAALLTALELEPSALGYEQLGRMAMVRDDFDVAAEFFTRAATMGPSSPGLQCAQAVNLAHLGRVEQAVEVTRQLAAAEPDYGPAWYNLAWWLAVDLNRPAEAAPFYRLALRHGMLRSPKIEERLEEATAQE